MKYTNRSVQLGEAGLVQSVSRGPHDFLYDVTTDKNPAWNVGDEVAVGGGRVCVYCRSTGASELLAGKGCEFSLAGYTADTAFAVSAAVGAASVTVPAATHAALTKDELAGGTIVIYDGASDIYTTSRMIVGNDAAAANAAFVVYLDAELRYAVTSGTSTCETFKSPYAGLVAGALETAPKAGVPMSRVPASASYFWVLKRGLAFVIPDADISGANGDVGIGWTETGTVKGLETILGATVVATDTSQVAGYRISGDASNNGPLVMLTG